MTPEYLIGQLREVGCSELQKLIEKVSEKKLTLRQICGEIFEIERLAHEPQKSKLKSIRQSIRF